MPKRTPILLSLFTLGSISCATAQDSTLLGVSVGAVVGSGFGAAVGQSSHRELETAAIGAGVGAAIGGLAGYLGYKEDQKKFQSNMEPDLGGKAPNLSAPEVRRIWVPDRIDGDSYETGHYIYQIERPSIWKK